VKILPATLFALYASVAAADSNPYTVESAIYRVEVPYLNSNRMGFGTGVLIAQDKILTNCHVVKNHPGWPRVVHRETGRQFNVTKHYNLGSYDACVLVGSFSGIPVQFAENVRDGENIWIFGYPAGEPVVGQGSVKGLVDTDSGKSILLAAFCAPGSSGGPVVNSKGQLIGLNWGTYRYQNQCLSIPASYLRPYLTNG
jgi:S1-C subfamily serine protease